LVDCSKDYYCQDECPARKGLALPNPSHFLQKDVFGTQYLKKQKIGWLDKKSFNSLSYVQF